jgi:hypothetical protein
LIIEDFNGGRVGSPGGGVSDRETEAVSGLFGVRGDGETEDLKEGFSGLIQFT